MRRLTLWLMAGLTGWLALKSLGAEQEGLSTATRPDPRRGQRAPEYSESPREVAHEHRDRGRAAKHPSEIPPLGWKDIFIRTYRSLSEDRVTQLAAGVTYYVLLALFPGITALVSIYGLIADPGDIGQQMATLAGTIPQAAIDLVGSQLHFLASQDQKTLGLAFFAGLVMSLWSANAAMSSLFSALNVVYSETERRGFLKLTLLSLAFTAGLVLFLALAMIAIVVIPALLDFMHLGRASEVILNIARWPAMLAIVVLALPLRPFPRRRALALDHLGQRGGGGPLADRIHAVLLVRQQLRQLQQDLRLAGRGHRLHGLELVVERDRTDGRRAQRRSRAPDRARQHHRPAQAPRRARRSHGGHRRRGPGLVPGIRAE